MGDFAEQPVVICFAHGPEIVFLHGHLRVVSDEMNYTRESSKQISAIGQGKINRTISSAVHHPHE